VFRHICLALLSGVFLSGQAMRPERTVEGSAITSQRDPAVRIGLPISAQYVGADRFVLFGIADCELHALVEADGHKTVERLYWVQFEQYLPTRPELHHTYDSPRHTTLGGWGFYVDTWVRSKSETTETGSDLEHIAALIEAKGYHLPQGMMYVRLVHLLDEQKRKELMIIYAEDLRPTGLTAAELKKDGSANTRWPRIDEELIKRAEKRVEVEPLH
jgi:hypothetical protein